MVIIDIVKTWFQVDLPSVVNEMASKAPMISSYSSRKKIYKEVSLKA